MPWPWIWALVTRLPKHLTNQVVNTGYSGSQQAQSQVPVQQSAHGGQVRSYPTTSSTASTVRRKLGIPSNAMSSSSSVTMIINDGMFDDRKIVILDSGSNVSFLPQSFVVDIDGPADGTQVRLRDC